MKSTIVFVMIVAAVIGVLLCFDLSRVRKAKDVVDHVYLGVATLPSESQSNLLAQAEHDLSDITDKLWLLPKGSIKSAEFEIHGQLFIIGMTLENISILGKDKIGEKLAGEECDKYAQKIPEFKRKLEYIRRTL